VPEILSCPGTNRAGPFVFQTFPAFGKKWMFLGVFMQNPEFF
jgi:hypothetical protein